MLGDKSKYVEIAGIYAQCGAVQSESNELLHGISEKTAQMCAFFSANVPNLVAENQRLKCELREVQQLKGLSAALLNDLYDIFAIIRYVSLYSA